MLIKCPECKKEISDQSAACIHCGFPLKKRQETININNKEYSLMPIINDTQRSDASKIRDISDLCQISLGEAKDIYFNIKAGKVYKEPITCATKISSNMPRCPKCNSTAITAGARGVNFTWGLLGASKTVNRCANCGYTWRP